MTDATLRAIERAHVPTSWASWQRLLAERARAGAPLLQTVQERWGYALAWIDAGCPLERDPRWLPAPGDVVATRDSDRLRIVVRVVQAGPRNATWALGWRWATRIHGQAHLLRLTGDGLEPFLRTNGGVPPHIYPLHATPWALLRVAQEAEEKKRFINPAFGTSVQAWRKACKGSSDVLWAEPGASS